MEASIDHASTEVYTRIDNELYQTGKERDPPYANNEGAKHIEPVATHAYEDVRQQHGRDSNNYEQLMLPIK